jgi:hypothetical protein
VSPALEILHILVVLLIQTLHVFEDRHFPFPKCLPANEHIVGSDTIMYGLVDVWEEGLGSLLGTRTLHGETPNTPAAWEKSEHALSEPLVDYILVSDPEWIRVFTLSQSPQFIPDVWRVFHDIKCANAFLEEGVQVRSFLEQ